MRRSVEARSSPILGATSRWIRGRDGWRTAWQRCEGSLWIEPTGRIKTVIGWTWCPCRLSRRPTCMNRPIAAGVIGSTARCCPFRNVILAIGTPILGASITGATGASWPVAWFFFCPTISDCITGSSLRQLRSRKERGRRATQDHEADKGIQKSARSLATRLLGGDCRRTVVTSLV